MCIVVLDPVGGLHRAHVGPGNRKCRSLVKTATSANSRITRIGRSHGLLSTARCRCS